MSDSLPLPEALAASPIHVVFHEGALDRAGEEVKALRAQRVLVVSDTGIAKVGHVEHCLSVLADAGIEAFLFDGVEENPTEQHVARAVRCGSDHDVDAIVALGGGSCLDCAKGANLILTNGGEIKDYWGTNHATEPLLPFVAIPTTAGTGSEAQSFALISDSKTHQKMACGDRRPPTEGGLRPRVAILDPLLTSTLSRRLAITVGMDTVSHAVETAATRVRTDESIELSRHSWKILERSFDLIVEDRADAAVRADMLLAAHLAGAAIENSMLGAAHACANPLTAHFGITHGIAVGAMLPFVVRFNCRGDLNPYGVIEKDPETLAAILESWLFKGNMHVGLCELAKQHDIAGNLATLAEDAARQWTAGFNPTPITAQEALEIYKAALVPASRS